MKRRAIQRSLEPEFATGPTAKDEHEIYLQHHAPSPEAQPYHFHPTIEVNYLTDCDMTYSFSGKKVFVERNRLCVFWAAHPHRTKSVSGKGLITNAQISLSEFLRWPLPPEFRNVLLGGGVICNKSQTASDQFLTERWAIEKVDVTDGRQSLHALEIESRLYRLALEGWNILLEPMSVPPTKILGGNAILQFEKMILFVGRNFSDSLTVGQVAEAGEISVNYAISLFKSVFGRTIKQHITDVRIYHAKMLLAETDRRIVTVAMDCGFGSLSAFYDAFQSQTKNSPAAFRKGHFDET